MQLTQFTDYSLRVLIYLGERPDVRCTITDIAAWHDISKQHLVKVTHHLAKLAYIKSIQGKGGGIELAVSPSAINIGVLIEQTEPHFELVECFNRQTNSCRITESCSLKHLLFDAQRQFLAVLKKKTLEDILGPGSVLAKR